MGRKVLRKSKTCPAMRLRSMQVVKVSGDDLLPLLTAENEQGVTELQVEGKEAKFCWRRAVASPDLVFGRPRGPWCRSTERHPPCPCKVQIRAS